VGEINCPLSYKITVTKADDTSVSKYDESVFRIDSNNKKVLVSAAQSVFGTKYDKIPLIVTFTIEQKLIQPTPFKVEWPINVTLQSRCWAPHSSVTAPNFSSGTINVERWNSYEV